MQLGLKEMFGVEAGRAPTDPTRGRSRAHGAGREITDIAQTSTIRSTRSMNDWTGRVLALRDLAVELALAFWQPSLTCSLDNPLEFLAEDWIVGSF